MIFDLKIVEKYPTVILDGMGIALVVVVNHSEGTLPIQERGIMRNRIAAVQRIGQIATLGLVLSAPAAWASPVSLATTGPLSGTLTSALVSSQEAPPAAGGTVGSAIPRYRIHAGDTLEIKVIGRPELTQTVTVAPDGTIVFPYVGELNVMGNTSAQIVTEMQNQLKKQLVNPLVLVAIVKRQMGQVSIMGPIKEPGKRELGDDWHVLNLIAAAGGLTTERPEFVTMRLIRKGGQNAVDIDPVKLYTGADPLANMPLEDGDLLVIQERDRAETMVNVLGEVGQPGRIPCPRDGSPLSVLAAAGGPTGKASLSRAIIRRATSGPAIPIDLSNPESVDTKIQIGPGDILIIPANNRQVMVSGGVFKPGSVDLPERGEATLYWALQQAGGILQDSDLTSIMVVRMGADGIPVRTIVDLEKIFKDDDSNAKPTNGKGKPVVEDAKAIEIVKLNIVLQPGDSISVPVKTRRGGGGPRFGFNEAMLGLSTFIMLRQVR